MNNYEKIIVLEDGGNLLSQANQILKTTEKIVGIEQTSAGYEKLKDLKLNFPIINVARSYAKLKVESPMIAKTFIERLNHALSKLKLVPKMVLILGAGAIGNAIQEKLKEKYIIKKYDLDSKLSNYKIDELKEILGSFDMIIGCTGKEIINLSLYKYLKEGVILASASSSDREFSAVSLRKKINDKINCHGHIKVNDFYLLNCGFPVNFDGAENSANPNDIQITLALLFAAICLATKEKYVTGLIELDSNIQNLIIEKFKEL